MVDAQGEGIVSQRFDWFPGHSGYLVTLDGCSSGFGPDRE